MRAASLFGKVIEVKSGDVITVFNLNRPVRIRLLGVDAPELDQAFGDVARQHLSDLVYDKSVLVEYGGIGPDNSLSGRVLLDSADIGAQMIRDGVAWFDVNNANRLSVSDREVYQQSELAARSERRGLWQAQNPLAPWEFVKAQAFRKNSYAKLNATSVAAKRAAPTELTNLSLMRSNLSSMGSTVTHSVLDDPNDAATVARAMSDAPKSWVKFRPGNENFSAVIPDEGWRTTVHQTEGGVAFDVHNYLVRDGWANYLLTWMNGPTNGRTEESVLEEALKGILAGADRGYGKSTGQNYSCSSVPQKDISMNGYTGREFDLSSCTMPAKARVYVRVTGDSTQVYMAGVIFRNEDENVARFLKSFTVGSAEKSKLTRDKD